MLNGLHFPQFRLLPIGSPAVHKKIQKEAGGSNMPIPTNEFEETQCSGGICLP